MSTDLTTTNSTAVATNTGSSYIADILEATKRGFVEANAGLDMDFVHMGDWLVIDKKGNFVEKEDIATNYGDSIDVVIGYTEQRWGLWGKDNSPEKGQLIVSERNQQDAVDALAAWLEANPQAEERYSTNDIALRYLAYVVPVDSLKDGDFPKIYIMNFSPTATLEFGKWSMGIFKGKGKDVGIPQGTGISKIVTRLSTATKTSKKNPNQSWIGLDFKAVGMFDPAKYGIQA